MPTRPLHHSSRSNCAKGCELPWATRQHIGPLGGNPTSYRSRLRAACRPQWAKCDNNCERVPTLYLAFNRRSRTSRTASSSIHNCGRTSRRDSGAERLFVFRSGSRMSLCRIDNLSHMPRPFASFGAVRSSRTIKSASISKQAHQPQGRASGRPSFSPVRIRTSRSRHPGAVGRVVFRSDWFRTTEDIRDACREALTHTVNPEYRLSLPHGNEPDEFPARARRRHGGGGPDSRRVSGRGGCR